MLYVIYNTSGLIESLSGYIHNQVLGYYNILYTSIQSKYTNLETKIFPIFDFDSDSGPIAETKTTVLGIVNKFNTDNKFKVNLTHILKGCLNETSLGRLKKMNDFSNIQKTLTKTIPIMFPAIPALQIRITPEFSIGFGFYASIEPNWQELKFNLAFEVFIENYFSLKMEGGIYVPCSAESPFQTAFAVGFDGIIAHARAGLRLDIYLNELDITFDVYLIGRAFKFTFYCEARVELKTRFIQIKYGYDLFRTEVTGIETEFHLKNKAKKKFEGNKNYALTFGRTGKND